MSKLKILSWLLTIKLNNEIIVQMPIPLHSVYLNISDLLKDLSNKSDLIPDYGLLLDSFHMVSIEIKEI